MNFSCVYSIQCKDKEVKEFYIGSTKTYCIRYTLHKSNCNNLNSKDYTYPLYKFIRENGGWDNWEMIVEVKTPNLNKDELLELEQYYMDLLEPTLNGQNAIKRWSQDINNKKKSNCPHCNLEMLARSILRHIKRKHL